MTSQLPTTPSPELVASLRSSAPHGIRDAGVTRERWLIEHAYAAGADQELEACCEWLQDPDLNVDTYKLRAARRPKLPSLKEQALEALQNMDYMNQFPNEHDYNTIRRALEALDA